MKKLKTFPFAFLALMTLSGCGAYHDDLINQERPEIDHRIGIHPVHKTMEFALNSHGNIVGNSDSVQAYILDYARRGHGPLLISGPKSAIQQTKRLLAQRGVNPSSIIQEVTDDDTVTLTFSAFSAVPPQCGLFTDDDHLYGLANPSNKTSTNYGCATQRNTAYMLQDPLDAVRMRGPSIPDMSQYGLEPRTEALRQYEAPQPLSNSSSLGQ